MAPWVQDRGAYNSDRSSRLSRVGVVNLDDDDIEAIANRVAEKLRARTGGLVGVQDVARALGMSRDWVYRNAEILGARRLGAGPKPPLRFDLALTLERAQGLGIAARIAETVPVPRRRGRPPRGTLPPGVEVIAPRHGRRP
jgi:hypothetical protein